MPRRGEVLALVQAGGQGSRMDVLTRERAKPALPYGGVHRLIDFALSGLVHADLADVQAILAGPRSTVRLVLTPETVVVAEARRSLTTLSLFGYRVDGVVANRVFPSGDDADAWLGCLNDLRLVLGTRLEVTEDLDERTLAEDDPRLPALELYSWLGWLQESLLSCLEPRR